jgi:hypothetical protein
VQGAHATTSRLSRSPSVGRGRAERRSAHPINPVPSSPVHHSSSAQQLAQTHNRHDAPLALGPPRPVCAGCLQPVHRYAFWLFVARENSTSNLGMLTRLLPAACCLLSAVPCCLPLPCTPGGSAQKIEITATTPPTAANGAAQTWISDRVPTSLLAGPAVFLAASQETLSTESAATLCCRARVTLMHP